VQRKFADEKTQKSNSLELRDTWNLHRGDRETKLMTVLGVPGIGTQVGKLVDDRFVE
jgi:hypothetical protein